VDAALVQELEELLEHRRRRRRLAMGEEVEQDVELLAEVKQRLEPVALPVLAAVADEESLKELLDADEVLLLLGGEILQNEALAGEGLGGHGVAVLEVMSGYDGELEVAVIGAVWQPKAE
jgi:hypothetical protein